MHKNKVRRCFEPSQPQHFVRWCKFCVIHFRMIGIFFSFVCIRQEMIPSSSVFFRWRKINTMTTTIPSSKPGPQAPHQRTKPDQIQTTGNSAIRTRNCSARWCTSARDVSISAGCVTCTAASGAVRRTTCGDARRTGW